MKQAFKRGALAAALILAVPLLAHAVATWPTATDPVTGAVQMWFNGSQAVPNSAANPMPVGAGLSTTVTTPQSTLTRPANTTAYAGSGTTPQLIGSSATAGSVAVPSFAIANPGGYAAVPRVTIATNATSGWGNVSVTLTLWTAAPTYSAGDGGAYTVATGSANRRVSYSCSLVQNGDGASCSAVPTVGSSPVIHPAAGAAVYWDLQIGSAATPTSGQTFTVTPEVFN